jgi:single-strand DNA-binding protein|nr:MAG TPA: Single strand binding protein [Caudoviricetes sp.]
MNKIILMGRICSDVELKTTPNGTNVCTFRIAVDRRFQQSGEERKTDFFNVVAWRTTGEFVNRYFGKGRMILIEGEMQTRQYTDKSGKQSTWYEVNAERVSFTGEKSGNAPATDTAPAAPPTASAPQAEPAADFAGAGSDPYPF